MAGIMIREAKAVIDLREPSLRPLFREFAELKRQMRITSKVVSQAIAKGEDINAMAQQKWQLPLQYDTYLKHGRFRIVFHRQSVWLEDGFILHLKTKGGEVKVELDVPEKYRNDLVKGFGSDYDTNDVLGQIELIEPNDGRWINAHITLRLPKPNVYEPTGAVGTDIGWNNLATSSFVNLKNEVSDVTFHGDMFKTRILQLKYLLKEAQRKGEVIKKWDNRLANTIKYAVGKTAKEIVEKALEHHAVVCLERLSFRSHTKRYLIPRYKLKQAIKSLCEYKGVPYREVEARYTSQMCSRCGYVDKKNRVGKVFKCMKCGYEVNADFNASVNIARRGIGLSYTLKLKEVGAICSHTSGQVASP